MATKKLELNSQILGQAQIVQNFLDRLRAGDGIDADLGRLARMHAILTETTETKLVQMLWVVTAAKDRWQTWAVGTSEERWRTSEQVNAVRRGLEWNVDWRFHALTDGQILAAFAKKKHGPAAIAARLSVCVPEVFSHQRPKSVSTVDHYALIADRFYQANKALSRPEDPTRTTS